MSVQILDSGLRTLELHSRYIVFYILFARPENSEKLR